MIGKCWMIHGIYIHGPAGIHYQILGKHLALADELGIGRMEFLQVLFPKQRILYTERLF